MGIDPEQPISLYFQLKTLLVEAILSGEYGPGERLPTEHELCELYAISRTPVSRALSEMADEGVILRHRRRGTFVNPHWLHRRAGQREVRVVVPEGPWEGIIRGAAPGDIHIDVVTVPLPSLHRFLALAVAEGHAPDLAVLDSVWVPEFAADGFLRPLEELDGGWLHRECEPDFLDPLLAANRYEGGTFALPAVANVAGLWYRRDALNTVGFAPKTWSDLRKAGIAMSEAGVGHPIVMCGGSWGGETTSFSLIAVLASNGAQVLTPEGITVNSPSAIEALQFLRGLVDDNIISSDAVRFEWNRPIRLLANRQAGISFGGSYEARTLADGLRRPLEQLWDQVGFIEVPAGPRGAPTSVVGSMVYGIFRQASNPKLAMRVLEHLLAPETLVSIARASGRIPPRRSAVALAARDQPFVSRTAEMLSRAVSRPSTPYYPRVSAQLQAMLEAVLTRRQSPAAAAQRAAEHIAAITGLPIVASSDSSPRMPGQTPQAAWAPTSGGVSRHRGRAANRSPQAGAGGF